MQWDDFAAFVDIAELEHVCGLLENLSTAAGVGDTASLLTHAMELMGPQSYLVKRLGRQDTLSAKIIADERPDCPGLYARTWMGALLAGLYVRLDEIADRPSRLPSELPCMLLDLHKVLIAAHEVFDPHHRKELIAKAIEEDASERGRTAVNARHNAPGGATELKAKAMEMYKSGTYGNTKDDAAEKIAATIGVSYSTARKYLRQKTDNRTI